MKISAGILMFRRTPEFEVFIVHPGGPFFKNKDIGSWSIPKGEVEDQEQLKDTAIREFQEETGIEIKSTSNLIYLDAITQKSGKKVFAWAYENDFQGQIKSNFVDHPTFGKFPEIDKAQYFDIETAKKKLNPAQIEFINRLQKIL